MAGSGRTLRPVARPAPERGLRRRARAMDLHRARRPECRVRLCTKPSWVLSGHTRDGFPTLRTAVRITKITTHITCNANRGLRTGQRRMRTGNVAFQIRLLVMCTELLVMRRRFVVVRAGMPVMCPGMRVMRPESLVMRAAAVAGRVRRGASPAPAAEVPAASGLVRRRRRAGRSRSCASRPGARVLGGFRLGCRLQRSLSRSMAVTCQTSFGLLSRDRTPAGPAPYIGCFFMGLRPTKGPESPGPSSAAHPR